MSACKTQWILRCMYSTIATHIEREMAEEQAGFRKGKGTRDHIANMRWIIEKAKEYGKTIFMCFIDYSKAFDCVDHSRLWDTLRSMGVPEHLTVIIKSLYTNQEAAVRTEHGNTDWFEVRKGVRQGCILSPYLFIVNQAYLQLKLSEASREICKLNTPFGSYKCKRMPFGISSALGIYQEVISSILADIEHTFIYLDDILLWGTTQEECLQTLHQILTKLKNTMSH